MILSELVLVLLLKKLFLVNNTFLKSDVKVGIASWNFVAASPFMR